jgi:hypothetical protein
MGNIIPMTDSVANQGNYLVYAFEHIGGVRCEIPNAAGLVNAAQAIPSLGTRPHQ